MLDGQLGFAADLALDYQRRFGADKLFRAMDGEILTRLRGLRSHFLLENREEMPPGAITAKPEANVPKWVDLLWSGARRLDHQLRKIQELEQVPQKERRYRSRPRWRTPMVEWQSLLEGLIKQDQVPQRRSALNSGPDRPQHAAPGSHQRCRASARFRKCSPLP